VDWSGEGPRHTVPQSCCNETTAPVTECDGSSVDDIYTDVRPLDDVVDGGDDGECDENNGS